MVWICVSFLVVLYAVIIPIFHEFADEEKLDIKKILKEARSRVLQLLALIFFSFALLLIFVKWKGLAIFLSTTWWFLGATIVLLIWENISRRTGKVVDCLILTFGMLSSLKVLNLFLSLIFLLKENANNSLF